MTTRSITALANGLGTGPQPDIAAVTKLVNEATSKKHLILEALHKNGRAQTVMDLVHWTKGLDHGLNAREITKLLWALQKVGYVKFTERSHDIVKIDLTREAVADLWPQERKQREPIERVSKPTKPKVVKRPYKVPEPPRYAKPEPPPQNTKEVTVVDTDTHIQYLKEMAIPYAKSPGTATSRQRVLRFLRDVGNAFPGIQGGWILYSELRAVMGMKSGNISVLVKSAVAFDYADLHSATGSSSFRINDAGRRDVEAFADLLDVKFKPSGPPKKAPAKRDPRGHSPQDQSIIDLDTAATFERGDSAFTTTVEPMEVVRRDPLPEREAVIVPKLPDLTDFPALVNLLQRDQRRKKYEQAAAILMEDDPGNEEGQFALQLLDKIGISAEQAEMITFIRAVIGS